MLSAYCNCGSIVLRTASDGTAAQINSYDEYGIPSATNTGRFQYTGQVYLAELGMFYYKARMYSPALGRFTQTDPIGYEDNVNLYAYTTNDPVNRTDWMGTDDSDCDGERPDGDIIYVCSEYPKTKPSRSPDLARLQMLSVASEPEPQSDVCTTGRRINLSVGVGGTLAAGLGIIGSQNAGAGISGSVEMGISIPLDSILRLELTGAQSFFRGTGTVLGGVAGGFIGGGETFGVSTSNGPRPYQNAFETSSGQTVQGGAAYGVGGELIVADGGDAGIAVGPRGGLGAYIGRGLSGSIEHATDPIGCP